MRCSIVVRIVVAQVNVMLRTLNRRGDPRDASIARLSSASTRHEACAADIGSANACAADIGGARISGTR